MAWGGGVRPIQAVKTRLIKIITTRHLYAVGRH